MSRSDLVKLKVSNKDAWGYIAHAWNDVKPQSIRQCFRHVPIVGANKKGQLSQKHELDPDVALALSHTRSSIHRPITKERETTPSTSTGASTQHSPQEVDQNMDIDEGEDDDRQENLPTFDGKPGHHAMLLGSVTKLLDGSPSICECIDGEKDIPLFQSFFVDQPRAADILSEERLPSDDDDDDDDYYPPMELEEAAEDEDGNLLSPQLISKSWSRSGRTIVLCQPYRSSLVSA